MSKYNAFPLGKVRFPRPEPIQILEMGYNWDDPRDIIAIFEQKVADFAGSRYAVAVDCCSHALFLCLRHLNDQIFITVPINTYVSVPQQIRHAGYFTDFNNYQWEKYYYLEPTHIIDAAAYWKRGMYIHGSLMCLSFQIKKPIPIGRGGMILCDSKKEYDWLKLASYDGRDLSTPYDSAGHVKMEGYHYYMTPEDAARGIIIMDNTEGEFSNSWESYPSIRDIW